MNYILKFFGSDEYRVSKVGFHDIHENEFVEDAESTFDDPNPCDMAMVYQQKLHDEKLDSFFNNLKVAGLRVRFESGTILPEYKAAIITAPKSVLTHYSKVYGYELTMDNPNFVRVETMVCCRVWQTELTHPSVDAETFKRAKASVMRLRPTSFTSIERIMIVNKVMVNNQYTDKSGKLYYGYDSLRKYVEVYPLHGSTWRWSKTGVIEDRQLLFKYWASIRCLFKVQPLFMIEKYFSTETAFYFLYLGFYNKMLIPLTLIGLLAFLVGLIEITISPELNEFCNLDLPICPICQNFNVCPTNSLKQYCSSKAFALMFDNTASVAFAVFTSLWSIVYLIMWRRKQATMALRWNVRRMNYDETLRPEFKKHANVMKISRFTQKQTIDLPFALKVKGYVLSYASIMILLSCSIFLIFLSSFYRHLVHILKSKLPGITEVTVTISASYIYYFLVSWCLMPMIKKLAVTLTILECHRTQQSYDCSIIYKECLLSLPSFYGVMIYLSLFKGKFFTYPTDAGQWYIAGAIPADTCNPAGCMIDVTVQFIVIMTTDVIIATLKSIRSMYLRYFFKVHKIKFSKKINYNQASRWEKDYLKTPTSSTEHIAYFKSLMISYGLITWFAVICPLGPLFALMRHLVELRLHAFDFLIVKRRVIGEKTPNIRCWNNIMIIITLFGIMSNGVMITFSSTTIHRFIYAWMHGWTLKGYVRKSIMGFDTKKFSEISGVVLPTEGNIAKVCYFRGYQVDADEKETFIEANHYWFHLVVQVVFLLVYENLILIAAGLVFLLVPSVPQDVALKYRDEEDELREKRIEILNNRYLKQNQKQVRNR